MVVVVEVVEPPAGRLVGMFVDDRQTRFARVLPAFHGMRGSVRDGGDAHEPVEGAGEETGG